MMNRNIILGTALSSAIVIVGTFISGVLTARLLGPEARGVYGILIISAQTGFGLATLSFYDAVVISGRKTKKPRQYASELLTASIPIALLSLLASIILLMYFDFNQPDDIWIGLGVLTAYMLVESANRSLYSLELAAGEYRYVNLERIISVLAFALIIIVYILRDIDAITLVFLGLLCSKLPIFVMRIRRFSPHIQTSNFNKRFILKCLRQGLPLHIPFSFSLIASQADKIIIASFFPAQSFGLYLVCNSSVSIFFSVQLQVIGLIALSEFSDQDKNQTRMRFEKSFRLLLFFSIGAAAVSVFSAYILIPIVYGQQFIDAVDFTIPIALVMVFLSIRSLFVEYLRANGFWKLQGAMEASIILLGIVAAYFSNGEVSTFLAYLIAIYAVAIGVTILILGVHSELLSPRALVPDIAEAVEATSTLIEGVQQRIMKK